MSITGNDKVKEILEEYPCSFDVFVSNGFQYDNKEELIAAVGDQTMLKTVLQIKGVNLELFLYYLHNAVLKEEQERKYVLEDFNPWDSLDFYGNTICPLKFTFKDGLEIIEKKHYEKTKQLRKCYIEAGKNSNDSCDELWSDPNPELFPGILFTKEFNQYLGKQFQKEMSEKDYFSADFYADMKINEKMLDAGMLDPKGEYAMYGAMLDVFLIDQKKLGDLPVPKNRKELLDPKYKDNINLFGKDKTEISNATFLYIYKEFGMDGIRQLAHNVKHALHGAQMAKVTGTDKEDGAAISLVSWFFASTCVKKNAMIAWPEDGCMTLPMYLIVRKDKKEEEQDIIEYILGEQFAESCNKAYTQHINGNVKNNLPKEVKLEWLGWDYIRENDIMEIAEKCKTVFFDEWEKLHPGKELFV